MTAAGVLPGTWMLVATSTGLLRIKRQLAPSLVLVVTAPGWLAMHSGLRLGLLAATAVLPSFARPSANPLTQGRMA
jgi:hypothetical protein